MRSCTDIKCQHEVRDLTVELYGMYMFAGKIHPAFIQALMLFIWCSPGSPQADLLNSMLREYLQMPTSESEYNSVLGRDDGAVLKALHADLNKPAPKRRQVGGAGAPKR